MIIYDITRYELNLYTNETCNTLSTVLYRSTDKEIMKKELKYIKEHEPYILDRLKLVQIHTTFDTVDIDEFLKE